MYTSFIGRKFLTLWNARNGKALSAREFFDEEMFPLFFDDNRHLMNVLNSSFFQKVAEKDLSSGKKESEIRRDNLHLSVSTKKPNASFYVGYAAEDATGSTSGQVSNLPINIDHEEIYSSWIGEGLALGVGGGFYMLTDREEVLITAFEGWSVYRQFLNQTPNLKGRQIETWNGQWVAHCFGGGDKSSFSPDFEEKTDAKTKSKYWAINTLGWTKMVFALCKKFRGEVLTVYAYNLGQTNTTLGFLNIHLPEVYRLYEFRDKILLNKDESILTYKQIEELEPYYSFKDAAEFGSIGLRALEPSKLREYLPKKDSKNNKNLNLSKEDGQYQFKIFKLWIYAMLNRTELLDLAGQVAQELREFEKKGNDRGKKVNDQISDEVRSATSLRVFIDKLGEVLASFPSASETFRKVVGNVVKMPPDQFPLFIALIRFEYNVQKAQDNK